MMKYRMDKGILKLQNREGIAVGTGHLIKGILFATARAVTEKTQPDKSAGIKTTKGRTLALLSMLNPQNKKMKTQ